MAIKSYFGNLCGWCGDNWIGDLQGKFDQLRSIAISNWKCQNEVDDIFAIFHVFLLLASDWRNIHPPVSVPRNSGARHSQEWTPSNHLVHSKWFLRRRSSWLFLQRRTGVNLQPTDENSMSIGRQLERTSSTMRWVLWLQSERRFFSQFHVSPQTKF